MSYVLLGFGAGLRGEEVPLVSLEGLIMVTPRGRFKGETVL